MALPGSLQSLSFGHCFNQRLENGAFPGSLQSLSFGHHFMQSLENVALPGSLLSLSFVFDFNVRSLRGGVSVCFSAVKEDAGTCLHARCIRGSLGICVMALDTWSSLTRVQTFCSVTCGWRGDTFCRQVVSAVDRCPGSFSFSLSLGAATVLPLGKKNSPGSSFGSTPVGCSGRECCCLETVPKGGLQQYSNRNHCVCLVVGCQQHSCLSTASPSAEGTFGLASAEGVFSASLRQREGLVSASLRLRTPRVRPHYG